MSYRRVRKRDLWEIYRRWRAGHPLAQIAASQGRDRKTVRRYLEGLEAVGLTSEGPRVSRQHFNRLVERLLPQQNQRPSPASQELLEHRAELQELITRKQEPLKPKTAYQVIKTKYELHSSYETFKRVARAEGLQRRRSRQMIRIELPPGRETQLDYGKVGTLVDPRRGGSRTVWAFCAVLAHSRLPHVEFVWTQDQSSFVNSFCTMWETYDGVTEFASLDNLKAGVTKPDLWDPQINRALAEAAEHYGVFVDPCRVGVSTDKGKIERLVPVARELFRRLRAVHPSADLAQLNRLAQRWCREEYGVKEHGTTGVAPVQSYREEHPVLKRLPAEGFQAPVWKPAKVHGGDQFFTFAKMRFSMPPSFKGHTVWVRFAAPLLRVFDQHDHLVRHYVVHGGQRIYWTPEDFPQEVRHMINGGYPAWILQQARPYGQSAVALLSAVLHPNAYLNARRARGMLELMAHHAGAAYFDEVCQRARRRSVVLPATLKRMLEAAQRRPLFQQQLPMSKLSTEMVRDVGYYIN